MARKKKTGKEELSEIIQHAISVDFKGELPEKKYLPDFESLPEIDRQLYKEKRNDAKNALRLFTRFGENLVHVYGWGWFGWNGKLYSFKEGPHIALRYAEKTSDAMEGEILAMMVEGKQADEDDEKLSKRLGAYYRFSVGCGNISRMNAMLKNAEGYVAADIDALDVDDFLLNVENGVLNLRAPYNGEEDFDGIVLEDHKQEHKISRIANTHYDPNAEPPKKFLEFMKQVMPDDETRLFLQRWFGYCLTGSCEQQAFLMFWGKGSNGKSTLMDIMHWLFGDYGMTTPFTSLVRKEGRGGADASPDLARLPGARYLNASEPSKGMELDDGTIKMLTGSDVLTVRHLNKGFFEFNAKFKLCLACNNKPKVLTADEGMWRRILLVPFEQQFVDADLVEKRPGTFPKTPGLEEELKAELPGILNWMLDGYRMWSESGLKVSEKVRIATNEYRYESNCAAAFLAAWCERGSGFKVQANSLYDAYVIWCKQVAKEPEKRNKFGMAMTELEVERNKSSFSFYKGIQLTTKAGDIIRDEQKIYPTPYSD